MSGANLPGHAQPILYNYFRSSTSYRVRVALEMKGIAYHYRAIHLRKGEQRSTSYLTLNRQGLVPTLELANGTRLMQSLAIIEYLDEVHPEPSLLPGDALGRARVRAIAQMIALDIHPINNLRVLAEIRARFSADEDAVAAWFRRWVEATFGPLEILLASDRATGRFCHGDGPTLADICLVAQVANNARFQVDMSPYPTIARIAAAAMEIDAFKRAAPAAQPDAE
jgi:maleylpyruvate isomerase